MLYIYFNYCLQMQKLFVCPRCDNYASKLTTMGRWNCRYHPGTYDPDTGYSCCGQKIRPLRYNPNYVLLGAHEEYVKPPKGCTPCDCGEDLAKIHVDEIKQFLDEIDISAWKGFCFPYLYRSKDSFESV